MALFISENDVERLVSMEDAISAVAEVFRLSGEEKVINPPRQCVATEEEMKAIETMNIDSMTAREAIALELAEKMNASGKMVMSELFDKLHASFSPREIIELMAAVGLMVFASRLADALGLEADL